MHFETRRLPVLLLVAVFLIQCCFSSASADEAVINTPVVMASLAGRWELQPKSKDEFKQRLILGGSVCGEWQQSRPTLPVTITHYIEGNELLIQHYYEPKESFNYRLKQLRYRYKLDKDTLTLTRDGVTQTWKRIKKSESR